MIVNQDQTLQRVVVGVGQATIPEVVSVQVPVVGNSPHHLSMRRSVPFIDPSPMRKGYPHFNVRPRGMDWINPVRNSTNPSQVRKTAGRPATGRWSAQALREWLVGQRLARTTSTKLAYHPENG